MTMCKPGEPCGEGSIHMGGGRAKDPFGELLIHLLESTVGSPDNPWVSVGTMSDQELAAHDELGGQAKKLTEKLLRLLKLEQELKQESLAAEAHQKAMLRGISERLGLPLNAPLDFDRESRTIKTKAKTAQAAGLQPLEKVG